MSKETSKLPQFMSRVTTKEILANELLIFELAKKFDKIHKMLTNNTERNPDVKLKVARISLNIVTNASKMESSIKERAMFLTLPAYLKTLKNLVEDYEELLISNNMLFFNQTLKKHYVNTFNNILLKTSAMDIINFCSATLTKAHKENPEI